MNWREVGAAEDKFDRVRETQGKGAATDVAVRSKIIREQFELFHAVASLYQAGIMVLDEGALADPFVALSQFLLGYAFERQGRSPSYAPIARHVAEAVAKRAADAPDFWSTPDSARAIWDSFCSELDNLARDGKPKSPNAMVNPLCPRRTCYELEKRPHTTKAPSVVEFVQEQLEADSYNLVAWALAKLRHGQVPEAWESLCTINGIGSKIASFFLRDVAWCFEAHPDRDRELLQPVDVWVRRTVFELDRSAEGREAEWIVEQALEAGALPEAVNAGIWYFGALIAGSELQLFQALDSPQYARRLVDEYVARLRRQADTWSQEEPLYAQP